MIVIYKYNRITWMPGASYRVVKNYIFYTLVPPKLCTPYSRNHVPRILETMSYVPQAQNYVPSTLVP